MRYLVHRSTDLALTHMHPNETGDDQLGPWLMRPLQVAEPRGRILCLGHAGAGAATFRPWGDLMAPEVEILAVRLPGRESRIAEPPPREPGQLIPPLIAELEPIFDLPYAIFGHCSGASIAYELAIELAAGSNPPPALVALSGQVPPQRRPSEPIDELSPAEFAAHLRELGGMDPEVLANAELMELIEPTLRADFTLAENLNREPRPTLTSPLSILAGREDPIPIGDLAAWSELCDGRFTLRLFDGGHFFDGAEWEQVARAVRDDFARVADRRW